MKKEKRVACFFTGGYTEVNAMKMLMRKINNKVEYIQLCPVGEKKSKSAIKSRHIDKIAGKENGITGEKLIEHILGFVKERRFEEEQYDVILIEDDKDDRFLFVQEDGTAAIDQGKWKDFKDKVIRQINETCPNIPVIFFYAAPEVEAWFLADWDNSFGNVYKEILTAKQNDYFSVRYRQYINNIILIPRYKNCIEEYGFFDGKYKKLSDQVKEALENTDFWEGYMSNREYPVIHYSKSRQGEEMLQQVDPQVILQSCSYYFKEGYWALQAL